MNIKQKKQNIKMNLNKTQTNKKERKENNQRIQLKQTNKKI